MHARPRRLGEERLSALIQESFSVAHRTGALTTRDPERVVADITVQPKGIAFPTDVRLTHKAVVMPVKPAAKYDVPRRQSYVRAAKQFKRHNRELSQSVSRRMTISVGDVLTP